MEPGIFPTTIWSQVRLGGASAGAPARDEALAELARRYQAPAEAYLRAALRLSREEAHELFQEFFAWMLSSDFLAKAERERGRFRAFVKVALKRFASDARRRELAQKRGGGERPVALDAEDVPELADRSAQSPEELLDQAWKAALIDGAFARLRTELEARGRAPAFAVFADTYLAAGPEPDYKTLAARHGCTTTDISNWLQRAKQRFRELLRAAVLETVRDPAELGAELAWLFEEA
ncbi:MAG: sigma-70 family RNA polymerase sigma factor [Planctomycetes bacterium]|nr:sigma-70 family RNA polymerase sigma factor [Planctomycetota bacterium]